MAQGPMSSRSILVTIRITDRIQESEVRNPDSLDYRITNGFWWNFPAFRLVLSLWLRVCLPVCLSVACLSVRPINRSTSERAAQRQSTQREMLYVLTMYPAESWAHAYAPTSLWSWDVA